MIVNENRNVLMIGNNIRHSYLFLKLNFNVYVAVGKNKSINNRLSSEINNFNKIYIKNEARYFKYFHRILEIKKWIKKYNFAIIFTNTKMDLVCSKAAIFFQKKKPLILCTFHNSLAWSDKRKVSLLSKLINACSNGCICLSKNVFDILKNKISHNKLLYQVNCLDCTYSATKNNYNFDSKKPISIGYTAVVNQNKNQIFAVDVIKELKKKYNVRLYCIGDIRNEQHFALIKDKINKYNLDDAIIFKGSMDNMLLKQTVLPKFDLYFSPSLKEMSPINILEAKACGLPIIASHAFGQQDLINDGFDGLLYEDGSVADAVAKIEYLINNAGKRQELGKNAINYCLNVNNIENATHQIRDFIDKICKQK